jgi:4-oxalocrotonate tautomerase
MSSSYQSRRAALPRAAQSCFVTEQEIPMPTLRVELMEGRTPEQKKALVRALTDAVVQTLGNKPEGVDVILYEIKRHDWATGGELWSEKN